MPAPAAAESERQRVKRPDRQVYVPRGRRAEASARAAPSTLAQAEATTSHGRGDTLREGANFGPYRAGLPGPGEREGFTRRGAPPTSANTGTRESAAETCAPLLRGDDAGCSDEVALENPSDDAAEKMLHLEQVGSAREKTGYTPTERPRCAISLDSVRSGSERTLSNEDGGDKRATTCQEKSADSEHPWNPTSRGKRECVAPKVLQGITASSEVHKAPEVEIDYTKFEYLTPTLSQPKYGHILEMYDFPAEFETEDLESALSSSEHQFTIKRVDGTHALAVFSTPLAATQALGLRTPLVKMRPISEACTQSRVKVKRYGEFLAPFKSRPQTSAAVAVRLLSGSLGVRAQVDPGRRQREQRGSKEKEKSEGKCCADAASYGDVP